MVEQELEQGIRLLFLVAYNVADDYKRLSGTASKTGLEEHTSWVEKQGFFACDGMGTDQGMNSSHRVTSDRTTLTLRALSLFVAFGSQSPAL